MDLLLITSRSLSLAVRLVVIVAVFGFSFAQASTNTHGKLCVSQIEANLNSAVHSHGAHSHDKTLNGHTHVALDDTATVDTNGASVPDADKSDCCKSFCSSVALLGASLAKDHFSGASLQNAFAVQQLEAAADAAIFTPPNL